MSNKYIGRKGLTELINLFKADLSKKQDWFQFTELPSPSLYVGKVVQYTGVTTADFTKGYFYISNGTTWTPLSNTTAVLNVSSLPAWSNAQYGIIYCAEDTSTCYIKGSTEGQWHTIKGSEGGGFKLVTEKPSWMSAKSDIIYFVIEENGMLTGYIKSEELNEWYTLGGGSDLELVAISDEEIQEVYNEA